MIFSNLKTKFSFWRRSEGGVAAVEAALVFPLLAILLLGTFDMGNAIVANNKVIRASQVTADLVTRAPTVETTDINEAINAGELALQPFDTSSFGVDIVSVRFNEDSDAIIEWRETRNMTAAQNILDSVTPLATPNGGVVVVTVEYKHDPLFVGFGMGGFHINETPMQERAFARGRKTAVVSRI